jgi:nucleotide-binding universal stress UspA family protein
MNNKKILIAVDDTEATEHALTYVGQIIAGTQDVQVLLVHMPAPIPPGLLEYGGSEDPEQERRLEARLTTTREAWIEQTKNAAEPVFARARALLQRFDVPAQVVATRIITPLPEQDLTSSLLHIARSQGCGTLVVGRSTFSWFKELLQQHVADKLLQEAQGLTIWVVQSAPVAAAQEAEHVRYG